MLRQLIAGVVLRPVTVTMVTVALLLFGLVAVFRMPVELLPDLGYPSITVQTSYPDAAPAEVEELITRPIEELVGGVPGIVSVESVSREGISEVVLDFVWGTAIDRAMADVREKLDRVRLPVESERPLVLRYDPAQEPILRLALVVTGDTDVVDFRGLRDVADRKVKQSLEKLSGVAAVQIHGGDEEEVLVELDPERLSALGVDAGEVVTAITTDNINRPGGGLTERDNRYLIRTVHEARTAEELGAIIVRSAAPGQGELHLRDVVITEPGHEPGIRRAPVEREEVALVDGREAIELAVFREGDANTVRVAEQVVAQLGKLGLPEGQRVIVLSNQATFIDAAIQEVILNTLLGGALAILVLLFFLRELRSTLVIGVAIPISLLVAFVPLTMLGVSLNLMSLGGLALGVGMLVDNSIVVLEAIARIRERSPELSKRASATLGASEVAASVVASTLTTVAVFFPMAFVEGVAGQLIRDLAYAVSFSILSSLLVSLTLVPVMQALGGDEDGEAPEPIDGRRRTPLAWLFVLPALLFVPIRLLIRALGWLLGVLALPLTGLWNASERAYPKLLRGFLRVRVLVLLVAFGGCAVILFGARDLGRTLLPEVRQGEVYVQIELPQGTALEHTTLLTNAIARELGGDERLALVFARVGSVTQGGSATGGQTGTHLAQINLRLVDELVASPDLEAIENELFARATEVGEQVLGGLDYRLRLGRPELFSFEAPIEVRVFADESADAIAHAKRLLPRLRELDELADVAVDDLRGRPEVRVEFDRERLGLAGLDVDRASTAVQRAIQGGLAGKLHAPDKQLDIRVRLPAVDRAKVGDIERITVGMVATTDPAHPRKAVPLAAVASVEPTTGPAEIRRIDGRRGLRIRARAAGEGSSDLAAVARRVEDVLEVASAEIPANNLPGSTVPGRGGVEAEVAGQAEAMGDSLDSLAFTAGLALFLVYVVMASSFESLGHPLLIMVTVPLAAVGVVLACLFTHTPISAMVGIGGIILGGIVVNNAIVLVDAINQRRGRGLEVLPAVIEASGVRLRPILMTTATTVLGLLPMALGLGEGAALRQPLALSVIGGLVVSTALTLLVIPCAYALVPGRRRRAWSTAE